MTRIRAALDRALYRAELAAPDLAQVLMLAAVAVALGLAFAAVATAAPLLPVELVSAPDPIMAAATQALVSAPGGALGMLALALVGRPWLRDEVGSAIRAAFAGPEIRELVRSVVAEELDKRPDLPRATRPARRRKA